ncbi:MAG: DNA mismatch repair endonuclease MutL [Clostridia bacterium]|nr:DNA mismatch repair endonuclease MutL [Clostridia bacterium]
MGKINVLDFEIANLIAAGEVVERPSSVLKELIENSIDSGATKIVTEIKRGGVALIRVTDNGSGIDREDLPVALKRHATSKISSRDDLDGITTLGFRGEALAAISSVSEVTIITKTREAEVGSMLTSEGGRILDISEVGCSDGTTVVVENLFFNVPARRKFLKKDSTEAMNVSALIEKVALSRPDIAIQFTVDGEEKFSTPGDGDLMNTVYAVFGKDFASKLIKAEGTANGIRVHGYIGRSDNVRKNRNLENIFINGRYVKSLTAMAALEKAYTSYIAPECFPACVLFLEMNPRTVDVNVHPAKLEVKFANEQPVFEAVYYTVKRALEEYEYRPEMTLSKGRTGEKNPLSAFVPIGQSTSGEQISFTTEKRVEPTPASRAPMADVRRDTATVGKEASAPIKYADLAGGSTQSDYSRPIKASNAFGSYTHREESKPSLTPKTSLEILEKYNTARPSADYTPKTEATPEPRAKIPKPEPTEKAPEHRIVGEAFDCYVIVECEGELLIIDKHAAHERVIFEDLKKQKERDGAVTSQVLMLPITVILSPEERSVAEEYKEELSSVGFDFSLDASSVNLTAIPDAVSAADAETLFVKMTDEIIEGRGNPAITDGIRREKALYQVACKAAIKGGRKYDAAVIEWLVERVLSMPDIIVCPHGRPIAYKLTKRELDRQFDRIK